MAAHITNIAAQCFVDFFIVKKINDRHKVTTDWFTVEIVGNKLIISFGPNKESWEQLLNLTVTAGDIFYTFNFRQLAHQK